ncbi:MAG: hypothetical protein AB8B78_15320 [Polaribacter sp.]
MKNIILLFLALISLNLLSQKQKTTTFHRMLILNEERKMLVVKIKNKDFWVTPGLYQNSKQSIKKGMDSIAKTYGLDVVDVKLRGIYGLKKLLENYYSTRNIFVMKTNTVNTKLPKILDNAKWLSINKAVKLINIPHINFFIKDVFQFPEMLRFGTVSIVKIDGKNVSKIEEEFYSLEK